MPATKRSSVTPSEQRKKFKKSFQTKPTVASLVQREIMKTAELKQVTTSAITASSTRTGTVVQLNSAIAQGDTVADRTGNRITTRDIDIQYGYVCGASNSSGFAQVALVYDSQPNASAPSYSTIFDDSTTFAGMAFKQTIAQADRFKIFWIDELPGIPVSEDGWQVHKRHYLRLDVDKMKKYMDVRYNTTSAAVPITGAWYLCYGDTQSTTNTALITYKARYRYTDA